MIIFKATWMLSILTVCSFGLSLSNIPPVGTGRRAQYHLQGRDGSYRYGHDTGEGAYEKVNRRMDGKLDGEFGYTGDDGNFKVQYAVGGNGVMSRNDRVMTSQTNVNAPNDAVQRRPVSPFINVLANPTADASSPVQFAGMGQRTGGTQIPIIDLLANSNANVGTRSGTRGLNSNPTRPYQTSVQPSPSFNSAVPSGGHVLNYKIPTHERRESIGQNKVVGNFAFTADDDGVRRAIEYEAGADTGFVAEGSHLPMGPAVPGAPSGRPTGKLSAVKMRPFVDPLANPNSDASYNFEFNSEQYSRSESSDSNGNVQGMYTVVDDDGTRRKHSYRAGKGIGFEVQEVDVSKGPIPAKLSRQSPLQSSPSVRSNPSMIPTSNAPSSSNGFQAALPQSFSSSPDFQSTQTAIPQSFSFSPDFQSTQTAIPQSFSSSPDFQSTQAAFPQSFSSSSGFQNTQVAIPQSVSSSPGFRSSQAALPENFKLQTKGGANEFGYVLTYN